jgi:hypothetical protein
MPAEENVMNSRRIKVALGAFGVVLMAASAGAQCLTGAWSGGAKATQAEAGTAHLIRAGY